MWTVSQVIDLLMFTLLHRRRRLGFEMSTIVDFVFCFCIIYNQQNKVKVMCRRFYISIASPLLYFFEIPLINALSVCVYVNFFCIIFAGQYFGMASYF